MKINENQLLIICKKIKINSFNSTLDVLVIGNVKSAS